MHPSGLLPELELGISAEHMKNDHHSARLMKMKWELVAYDIYTTIGIVRCTLGVATDNLAVKPYIPHKSLLQ